MNAPRDPTRDRQLVKLARALERALARRRKLWRQVEELDDRIRRGRKLISDMTTERLDQAIERGELFQHPDAAALDPEGPRSC